MVIKETFLLSDFFLKNLRLEQVTNLESEVQQVGKMADNLISAMQQGLRERYSWMQKGYFNKFFTCFSICQIFSPQEAKPSISGKVTVWLGFLVNLERTISKQC